MTKDKGKSEAMGSKLPCRDIRKRDGRIVPFEPERITLAASKALKAAGTANEKLAATIMKDVLHELEEMGLGEEETPDIELIQDLVEQSFIRRGLSKAAKSFILYRAQHAKIREGKHLMMDVQELVASYIDREDWRVNENSNESSQSCERNGHCELLAVEHVSEGDCRCAYGRGFPSA